MSKKEEKEKAREEEEQHRETSSRLWTPYGDPRAEKDEAREEPGARAATTGEKASEGELSDEELRKRIEEAMEKITVADVVLDMLVSLSSLAYQRMGIPKEVNEKYRDMEQARLAIDTIDSLLQVLERSLPEEALKPLSGTLDNLKMNFAKES